METGYGHACPHPEPRSGQWSNPEPTAEHSGVPARSSSIHIGQDGPWPPPAFGSGERDELVLSRLAAPAGRTARLPSTNTLFELTGAGESPDAATFHDPVYLLLARLYPLIKDHVLTKLLAAVSCTKALAELVEQAHRIRAEAKSFRMTGCSWS
jgi:hypothetical protein